MNDFKITKGKLATMTECQQCETADDHTKHEISLEFRELAEQGKARVSDDTSCMTCPT